MRIFTDMETPADYRVTPPEAPAPALVGDSAALFVDVRRKYRAGLPGTLQAAKWFRLEDVLNHAEAVTARAERAEARMKELQAELAEQEVAKLALIKEIHAQKGERKEKNG